MTIIVSSSDKEKVFENKNIITIGSNSNCDYIIEVPFDFSLAIIYDEKNNRWVVVSDAKNDKILFRGEIFVGKLVVEKFCKFKLAGSSEFIGIKILENTPNSEQSLNVKKMDKVSVELDLNEKLESKKSQIEKSRISIVKQIAFAITNIKKRLALNFKCSLFFNIALVFSSIVMMFGVTNYVMGLPIADTVGFLTMPTNIKMLAIFSLLGYSISLVLKHGVFLFLQNKSLQKVSQGSKFAQYFMIILSTVFICIFYVANLIYYMNPDDRVFYSIVLSLTFILLNITLSFACGYFKFNGHKLSLELDKYEYREDFEYVLNQYQSWIELFINNLSSAKLSNIKEKMFKLQIFVGFEIVLGLITAPFLAYGISNTLAMCFPEAAGWLRIENVRFSPIFLVLSTMLIVFAFFTLASSFVNSRKVNGSDVIKLDGFRNYFVHGVDILGLQNVRVLEGERVKLLAISIAIICIEFMMNTSFFMSEIGADLSGILISLIAATVPTALLVAETYMLSATKYELLVCESLISKLDV